MDIDNLLKRIMDNDVENSINDMFSDTESDHSLTDYLNTPRESTDSDDIYNHSPKENFECLYKTELYGEMITSPRSLIAPDKTPPFSPLSIQSLENKDQESQDQKNQENHSSKDAEEDAKKDFIKINKILVAIESLNNELNKSTDIDKVDQLALKIFKLQRLAQRERKKDLKIWQTNQILAYKKVVNIRKKLKRSEEDLEYYSNVLSFKTQKYETDLDNRIEELNKNILSKIQSLH